jgi:hypothetical protein
MSAKKTVFWIAFAVVPIVAIWTYGLVATLEGYEGTCGLLNRGFRCTRWEYVKDNLLSAFVAPGLIAANVTWLLIAAVVAVVFFLFRQRPGRKRST